MFANTLLLLELELMLGGEAELEGGTFSTSSARLLDLSTRLSKFRLKAATEGRLCGI